MHKLKQQLTVLNYKPTKQLLQYFLPFFSTFFKNTFTNQRELVVPEMNARGRLK